MNRWADTLRCGAPWGLTLFFALPTLADESLRQAVRKEMRGESYVLIEDTKGARLLLFAKDGEAGGTFRNFAPESPADSHAALAMTRSTNPGTRVRGLTLLSDVASPEALDAALVLLSDPVDAVREEATQLVIEHPDSDIESVMAIAVNDPSPRLRQAAMDLIDERSGD